MRRNHLYNTGMYRKYEVSHLSVSLCEVENSGSVFGTILRKWLFKIHSGEVSPQFMQNTSSKSFKQQ